MNPLPPNDFQLPIDLPPPPNQGPPPDLPEGWIPNPLVIGSCVEPIEIYILGLLWRLTQIDGTIITRIYDKQRKAWGFQHHDCDRLAKHVNEILGIFAALVCAHEAGLNNSSIQSQEAFYRLKCLDIDLRTKILERAAASIGVSKWQLGIFPEEKSGGSWTGSALSLMLIDGTIVKGSDYVSKEIPPMYLVQGICIDPELLLVQIEEGNWANHRCTKELYFARMAAIFKTIGITTGGVASDNTKCCVKFVTDNMPERARAVVITDSDIWSAGLASIMIYGSPQHLMDFRSRRVEFAVMLQEQWDAAQEFSKPMPSNDIEEAHRLKEALSKDRFIQQFITYLLERERKFSLSCLAERELDEPFSVKIWKLIRAHLSQPFEVQWEGHPPFIPAPLFRLLDIVEAMKTRLPSIPSEPALTIIQPDRNKRIVQAVIIKRTNGRDFEVAINVVLEQFYAAHINIEKLKPLNYVYESMKRIVGTSKNRGIRLLALEFDRYFKALAEAFRSLRDSEIPAKYVVAESILLQQLLYQACLATQVRA